MIRERNNFCWGEQIGGGFQFCWKRAKAGPHIFPCEETDQAGDGTLWQDAELV
jgi:hypothetical protein